MNTHLLSEHDHQIILDKIEARENLNHNEYVGDENYYNVDSDDSDDDNNFLVACMRLEQSFLKLFKED